MGAGAEATVTTAAAEKIYRARDGEAADIARRRWRWSRAPASPGCRSRRSCSTGSRLDRRTEVELAGDARFLARRDA